MFDLYEKNNKYGVNIWADVSEYFYDEPYSNREYLTESQYVKINDWCQKTFNKKVLRISYADFWFTSKKDRDWFLLYWTGIDSNDF